VKYTTAAPPTKPAINRIIELLSFHTNL